MSIKCPHCGLEQQPRIVTRPLDINYDISELEIEDDPHSRNEGFVAFSDWPECYWAIGKCLKTRCEKIFLLTRDLTGNEWKIAIIIPSTGTDYLGETPDNIKSAIEQAKKCLAINCNDAAAAMCRAALERMAKDKEAEGGWLTDKLKDLKGKELLTKIVYDAADRVKDWGNTALHDLLKEQVDKSVTEKLITLVDLVARDLYITPEQIRSLETKK